MRNYLCGIFTVIVLALSPEPLSRAQQQEPKDAVDEKGTKASVAFNYKLSYFIPQQPSPSAVEPIVRSMNFIDLNIRNDDSARTILVLEYEIYTTDKQSGIEVDHIQVVDRATIKPGEIKKRRSIPWKPDSIPKKCDPPTKYRINLRIVRIKYDSGTDFTGKVEAEKEKALKK